MDLTRFFAGEVVTSDDMKALQVAVSKALADLFSTSNLSAYPADATKNPNGDFPIQGLTVSATGGLTLAVAAGVGMATYADNGLTPDADAVSTIFGPYGAMKRLVALVAPATITVPNGQLPGGGSERWALLGLKFVRNDSFVRTDDGGNSVYYLGKESSQLTLTYGSSAGVGTATKPDIPADTVPLAYVYLTNGLGALTEANLDRTVARPSFGKAGSAGGAAVALADTAGMTLDNCRVYAGGNGAIGRPTMYVSCRPGRVSYGSAKLSIAAQSVLVAASPTGGKHRVALIYLDTSGTLQVAYGAEDVYANPVAAPSHVGKLVLAEITVRDDTTYITDAMIVDVRAFLCGNAGAMQRYDVSALAGDQSWTPGWTWPTGVHGINFYINGALVPESGYTEDGTTVTLVAPLGANAVVTLESPYFGTANPVQGHHATHEPGGSDPITPSTFDGLIAPKTHASSHVANGADEIVWTSMLGLVAQGFRMESFDGTTVKVYLFDAVIEGKMRTYTAANPNPVTHTPTLSANAWWYVYAYLNAGVVSVEFSTTGPDVTKRRKLGDTTRTYLGAIRTIGASLIVPFMQVGRKVRYLDDFKTGPFGTVASGTTATVDLSTRIPPHVNLASVLLQLDTGGTSFEADGGSTPPIKHKILLAKQNLAVDIDLDTNQEFTGTAVGANGYVWCLGYDQ